MMKNTTMRSKNQAGDEEYASFPEQHKFVIPEGAHWKTYERKLRNVGSSNPVCFQRN